MATTHQRIESRFTDRSKGEWLRATGFGPYANHDESFLVGDGDDVAV